MNKKAELPAAIVDFIAYGAYAIILVVFLLLFKISIEAKTNELRTEQYPELSGQQFALNYLRTPIVVNDETMTIADFIVISYETNAKELLVKRLQTDLGRYVKQFGVECYYLSITSSKGRFIELFDAEVSELNQCVIPSKFLPVRIPTHTDEIIEVRLGVTKQEREDTI
jgi:hypothetical protein